MDKDTCDEAADKSSIITNPLPLKPSERRIKTTSKEDYNEREENATSNLESIVIENTEQFDEHNLINTSKFSVENSLYTLPHNWTGTSNTGVELVPLGSSTDEFRSIESEFLRRMTDTYRKIVKVITLALI